MATNYTMDDAMTTPGPCTCFACGHPTTAGDEDWKYLFRPLEGHTITLCERHGTEVREHRLKRTVFGNTKYLRMFLKPNLHHKPLKFDVTQICRDHQRGNCTRGVMCRFLHICRKLPLQAPTPTYGAAAGLSSQSLLELAAGVARVASPTSGAAAGLSPDKLVSSSPSQYSLSSRMAPGGGASTPRTPISPNSPASLEALATILAAAGSFTPGFFSLTPPAHFLAANHQNFNGVVMPPPSITTSGTPHPFLAMPVPSPMLHTQIPPPQKPAVQCENQIPAGTSSTPAHPSPATQIVPPAASGPPTPIGGPTGAESAIFPFGKSNRESLSSLPLSPFLMSHTPQSSRPALRSVSNAAQPHTTNASVSVFASSPYAPQSSTSSSSSLAHTTAPSPSSFLFPSSGQSSSSLLFGPPAACQQSATLFQGPSANSYENVDTEASKAAASADLLKFAGIFHSSTA